MAAFYGT